MSAANLAKKLSKILVNVSKVEKSGYNAHQKYKYITESDLLDCVRKEIADNGIFIFSSIEDSQVREVVRKDKDSNYITNVKIKYTFFDGDSGESFSVHSMGEGSDSLDKGIFKAITGANKYFLLKNFMLSGDDDPEKDSVVEQKSTTSSGFGGTKTKKEETKEVDNVKKAEFGAKTSTAFGTKTTQKTTFGSAEKQVTKEVVKDPEPVDSENDYVTSEDKEDVAF